MAKAKAHKISTTLTGFESWLLDEMVKHYTSKLQTMQDEPRSIITKSYVNSCISELCSKLRTTDHTPNAQYTESEATL